MKIKETSYPRCGWWLELRTTPAALLSPDADGPGAHHWILAPYTILPPVLPAPRTPVAHCSMFHPRRPRRNLPHKAAILTAATVPPEKHASKQRLRLHGNRESLRLQFLSTSTFKGEGELSASFRLRTLHLASHPSDGLCGDWAGELM